MAETTIGLSIALGVSGVNAITKLDKSFAKISDSIRTTTANMDKLNKKISSFKDAHQRLSNFKLKISDEISNIGETIAKASAFVLPVKLAIDYEEAMVDIKKYIEFDNKEQFNALSEQIKAISADYGVDFKEITTIAASGGQQGLKAKDIPEYTKLVSKMATAFDMSGMDAGDAAAYIMNNFKLNIKELEKLGNQMNFLDDKMSMVQSNKLFEILNRTSSNAKILGLGADGAAAMGASMLSLGKSPEVAATALNSLYGALANLDGQGIKFHNALNKIGLDAQYLKIAFKNDAAGAVREFLSALASANNDERMGILTDMFGKEFSDDIGSLVTNSDILNQAFNLIKQNSDGSLDEAMSLKLSTAKSDMLRFKASAINLGISIGNAFMPIAAAVSRLLRVVADRLSAFITEFPTVSKAILGVIGGFLAWGALLPIIKIFSLSLAVMGGQISLVIKAFSLATTIFRLKYLTTIKLNAAYLITTTRLKLLSVWMAMSSGATKLASGAFGLFRAAVLSLSGAFRVLRLALIATGIGALVVLAGEIIANWDKVKEWFLKFGAWLKGIFQPVIDWFSKSFGGMFEWIGQKLEFLSKAIKGVSSFLGFGGNDKSSDRSKFDTLDNESSSPSSLGFSPNDKSSDLSKFDTLDNERSYNFTKESSLPSSNNQSVVVNLNGDFNIATNNGKFDLKEFEIALTQSIKRAIANDVKNMQNRSVIG
ncbi:phage tail tape measure protein [uncultured Campylobacter sp.]|uniref:phage tail tape measure protein n=1 Tax=uncultured Campylobacter sp. TaxID=218934 RepID=UPI0026394150|nr:phage tail tape measure protein [uncultured Campylobacter sp.]